MSATSRRSGVSARRRTVLDDVEALVAVRAAADLVRLAQELLLLLPDFERAFPRERTREASAGVTEAIRKVVRRDAFSSFLPRTLRNDLESLLLPTHAGAALPSRTKILELADASLKLAAEISPRGSAPHLVRAQRQWVFAGSRETVHASLENARVRASSPMTVAAVVLHLAILRADGGFMDEAIDLLEAAARLDPTSLAVNWTFAAYLIASGRRRHLDRPVSAIVRSDDLSAVRRRALALHGQFDALARVGVLPSASARERADRFLSLLPPLPPSGPRP